MLSLPETLRAKGGPTLSSRLKRRRRIKLWHGPPLTSLFGFHPCGSIGEALIRIIKPKPSVDSWAIKRVKGSAESGNRAHTGYPGNGGSSAGTGLSYLSVPPESTAEERAALVSAGTDVKQEPMQVFVLDQKRINKVLDLQATKTVSLTMRYLPGKKLRVMHKRRTAFQVAQARLDNWIIPGS